MQGMMKPTRPFAIHRLVLALAFVCVVVTPSTGGASRMVFAHVDTPASGQTMPAWTFYVAGWSFDCDTGVTPDQTSIGFWNLDQGGWWFPNFTVMRGVYRPDVQQAFSGLCPAVTDTTGFHLYLNSPVPAPGRWRVYVSWAAMDGTQYSEQFDVTLTW